MPDTTEKAAETTAVLTTDLSRPFEEIAERYGLMGGSLNNGAYQIPLAALAGVSVRGRQLAATDVQEFCSSRGLEVVEREGALCFPSQTDDAASWRAARHTFRLLFRWLSEENPRRLGRDPLLRWDRPRTTPEPLETSLAKSRSYLDRAYRNGFIPAEKKALVADLRTSQAMYMASVDADRNGPLVALLDSSSQIASFIAGFNSPLLRGVLAHPEAFENPDYRETPLDAVEAFRRLLQRAAPPSLQHVCFVNSGTEAVEKALALAALKFPNKGKRIVAFDGSFHGRTLLGLFSSWNPEKRVPFEIKGHETIFVPLPEDKLPQLDRPFPDGWLACWEAAAEPCHLLPDSWNRADDQLAREIEALRSVQEKLRQGDVFAVIAEPMQGEGGDRYSSARFFNGLRAVTMSFGVAFICDEVQAGMGLGGPLLWHSMLKLRRANGEPASPDFVCLAKKAQAGVVLSSIPDPHPTGAHVGSIIRGYYNALMIDETRIRKLGEDARIRLRTIAEKHPVIQNPRGRGLCFAFDMPDKKSAEALINQRFGLGYLVYIAGERTLRYRLQSITTPADLDVIFQAIDESLTRLQACGAEAIPYQPAYVWNDPVPTAHPNVTLETIEAAPWNDVLRAYGQLSDAEVSAIEAQAGDDPVAWYRNNRSITWLTFLRYMATLRGTRIHFLTPEMWNTFRDQIMDVENRVYEPARRDAVEWFEEILGLPRAINLVALQDGKVVGFSFGGPLDFLGRVRGCHEDPELGRGTCLYSADITVAPEFQGQGTGQRIKQTQLEWAARLGYQAVRSRNRVGLASDMSAINRTLGAVEILYYADDYGDDHAPCLYASIPLQEVRSNVHWSNGVEEPTAGRLAREDWEDWDVAALHKLSMCNWITPNYVRYMEWLQEAAPATLGHLYLSNGRDEATDKAIKTIRFHRPAAGLCLSFQGAYWGHTTAAARSLSDPRFGMFFPWQHVPYPSIMGDPFERADGPLDGQETQCLAEIRRRIERPEEWIGVFIEPLQERTGRRVSVRFLRALRGLCDELDVPLVFNESASWAYRASSRLFYSQATGVTPDCIVFYAGGQLGHTLAVERYFISKPLAMISTWDGDELSYLRLREQVRHIEHTLDEGFMSEVDRTLLKHLNGSTWRGSGWVESPSSTLRNSMADPSQKILLPPLTMLQSNLEALLEELKAMISFIEVEGDPRSRGCQHGETLRTQIRELSEIRRELLLKRSPIRDVQVIEHLARRQWDLTSQHFPVLMEELAGIGAGSGVSREDLVILNNYTDFRDIQPGTEGCTAIYVSGPGGVYLGQTWDMHASAEPYVTGMIVDESIVLTVAGCVGMMGMNRHGLGVVVNNLTSNDAQVGIIWPVLVRGMLQKATRADMGALLESVPLCSGHNYLLGGPDGFDNWETSGRAKKRTASGHASDAFFCHTNHYLDPDMRDCEGTIAAVSTTHDRYRRITSLPSPGGPVTAETVIGWLSSHEGSPRSICSHMGTDDPDASKTCGGVVCSLGRGVITGWKGCLQDPGNRPETRSLQPLAASP